MSRPPAGGHRPLARRHVRKVYQRHVNVIMQRVRKQRHPRRPQPGPALWRNDQLATLPRQADGSQSLDLQRDALSRKLRELVRRVPLARAALCLA